MNLKITLYELLEKYVKGKIFIYEITDEKTPYLRKKIKLSMGILNERIVRCMDSFNKLSDLRLKESINLYQNGIIKLENRFYYYNVENFLVQEYSKEQAIKTTVTLKKIDNLKIIGNDIFEVKDEKGYNILNLDFGFFNYFPESVDKINYIFDWSTNERSWETLNYIILYKNERRCCYSFIEEKYIELPKINFEEILDISENLDTMIIKDNNKIELFYHGEKKLETDKFIQRRGKLYFFEIKNRNKIFNEKGEEIKKGFKVISHLPNNLSEKVIILENTTNHTKKILVFDDEFEKFWFRKENVYNLGNKILILYKDEVITVLNLENKFYEIDNSKKKSIKILQTEPLKKSNFKIEILEIPYQIERGKFYYTNDLGYKKEYTKSYLINLNERGFKRFYLKELEERKYDITNEREKKANYKNQKIEKIFLEKSENSILGMNLFLCIIYKFESIEKEKLKIRYETYREKHFFQYNKEEGINRTEYGEENEYFNLIHNKSDLENLENELPSEVLLYLEKIIKH